MANENEGFRIFTGRGEPHEGLLRLPEAPPWRRFVKAGSKEDRLDPKAIEEYEPTVRESALATHYKVDEQQRIVDAVNAALYLRRPLLVTGQAGTGKSSLVYAVARELRLGPVLEWNITSKSTLKEGLYNYNALGRLEAVQAASKTAHPVCEFVTLGPLGTALLPAQWPKALLIDEIDKADLDLPNDLLNVMEEGRFEVDELRRESSYKLRVRTYKGTYGHGGKESITNGIVACTVFPFVVMTSNGEREFSAPFLRRCVQLNLNPPDEAALVEIVRRHLGSGLTAAVEEEAKAFVARRKEGKLSTDQLLNAVYLLERARFDGAEKLALLDLLYRELV